MFSFFDKRRYYEKRMDSETDPNKHFYARGFFNGSSVNHTKKHYADDKANLAYYLSCLKTAKPEERSALIESICYCKGSMRGYEEKVKYEKRRNK